MKRLLRTVVLLTLPALFLAIGNAQAVTVQPGDILVADFSAFGGGGGVILVRPDGSQAAVSSGNNFVDPSDIAVSAAGDIYVADGSAVKIIKVDAGTGNQTVVSQGGFFVSPVAVAVGAGNDLWVADGGAKAVIRVDATNGNQTVVSSGNNFVLPFGVALNKFGDVFVVDRTAKMVIKVDPGSGNQTVVSSLNLLNSPHALSIDQGDLVNNPGTIWVADRFSGGTGRVIKVDATNGNQTSVSAGGNFSSGLSGITLSQTNGDIFVVSFLSNAVIRVNPVGGAQTVLSSGGLLVDPFELAIFPEQPVPAEENTTWGRIKGTYR